MTLWLIDCRPVRTGPSPDWGLVHHPSDGWHKDDRQGWHDRPSMLDVVAKRCHVWVNGHTHGHVRSADRIVEAVQALCEFLNREMKCPGAPAGQQDPGDELWDDPARGLLWILDGLDEVVDGRLRALVAGWIRDILPERPHDRFLVTCRFQGYKDRDVKLGEKSGILAMSGEGGGKWRCCHCVAIRRRLMSRRFSSGCSRQESRRAIRTWQIVA